MFSLKVPDPLEPEESGLAEIRPKTETLSTSVSMREVQIVMSVDLTDPLSRAQARKTVDSFGKNNISLAKSRMLDRRILALAQADSGSGKIAAELQRLALKARDLASSTKPRRRGLLGGLFGTAEKRPASISDMLREMDGIVSSLMGSAEVLRQNNVALDGYESDIMTENKQVIAEIQRAEDFHAALVAAIDDARVRGVDDEVLRFATSEVLFPLEQHRQYLQGLLAVNQQAAISLAILRETNYDLVGHIQQITFAARCSHDLAVTLRQGASRGTDARNAGGETAYGEEADAALSDPAFQSSLKELFRVLEAHEVWSRAAAKKTETAVVELRDLSAEVLDTPEPWVPS